MGGVAAEGAGEEGLLDAEEAMLVADRLHLVVRPFLLRRLKADVAADLPPKVDSPDRRRHGRRAYFRRQRLFLWGVPSPLLGGAETLKHPLAFARQGGLGI